MTSAAPSYPPYALARALGRPVALGHLDEHAACVALARSVARHVDLDQGDPGWEMRMAVWVMRIAARRFDGARALDEARIRRVVWPLCEERRPGEQILAAADRVDTKTMRQDEVLALCRHVAQQTVRRRHGGRQ